VQSLLISTTAVAIAEIGDKTQLLSLILAAKYRRPLPICLGILIATLLNHALAAGLGALLAAWLTPGILKWIVAISFLAIGLWTLIPDTIDDEALPANATPACCW
jgi:putative Ca2+/H+ antiporter (TMEM165/GDT1 family)